MSQKFLLSAVLIFCNGSISNVAPLYKSKLPTPAFDFAKANHPAKKRLITPTPFWEVNKKNNTVDTAALKQSNWYATVIKNIEASEYEISKDDKTGMYVAPNRQQQLRASFAYNSFTLQPRSTKQDWVLRMQFSGIYANKKLIAQSTENDLPVIGSNKIVFNNSSFSTEYINSKEGVRQNFIINKEPAAKPKTINIKLQTNKGWYINKVHDRELHFAKVEGDALSKKITCNSLKVWDANNKELTAKFVVNKNHSSFEIEVNTNDATYPITIDPISSTPVATLDCNQAGARLGSAVASAGDVNGDGYSDVIVGAPLYTNTESFEGAFFIYHGSATGISTTPAATVESNSINARLGYSVATAGDVNNDGYSDVIVGANQYTSGEANEGAFFVYHGSATGINTTAITFVQSNQVNGLFGWSVASAGDVNGDGYSDIVVGYPGYSNGELQEGGAFIYHGSASGINTTVAAIVEGNQASDGFGQTVASAGDVNGDGYSDIIIGAHLFDNGETDEGAAFIYHGGPGGINIIAATMLQSNQASALLGYSVASAGDVNGDGYSDVIVGAPQFTNGQNMEGVAFIFQGSATGISTTAAAMVESNQNFAFLGNTVSSAGDVNGDGYSDVIAGAWAYDNGQADEGAAFLYLGSATGINVTAAAIRESNQAGASCGNVSCAGDVNGDGYSDLIVGAPQYDNPEVDEGAAFVYHGSPDGLKPTSNWQVLEVQGGANYGGTVACAGDVNSDGFSDVIVGAYIYNQVFNDDGKAFLYLGSAAGLSTTPSWTAFGSMANEYFGRGVAAAGDVNGDGYGDVIIGGYGYSNGQSQEGRVYLYYGSSGGLAAGAAWTYENNFAGSILGLVVAGAGDVNGDGYGDIITGAPQYDDGVTTIDEGKVYLFYGRSTIPDAAPNWSVESNQTGGWFGVSVAGLGDVNGDGYSDIIFGAQLYDIGLADEGAAFAYYGSATGLPATPNWTAGSNQVNAQFGICVASAGDVNGDGFSDAVVGATFYDNGNTDEGGAFVYYGSSTGLSVTADWSVEGNVDNSYFGYYLSSAGDVNGDGYSDVLVGAREISNGQSREGALYAYYGSSTGLSVTTSWYVESNVANALLGNSVASAGDVNGDGYSDVIGGAPYYGGLAGAAFVYYGNSNTGLRHNLKLYNTDLTTPIGHFNVTEPNLFGAGLFAKSSLGRVKGRLVWEVKKQGVAFSGNPITNSTSFLDKQASFTNLGIAGIELKNNVQKVGSKNNKIRARVEYDKATAITGQVYGPWRYPAGYTMGAHGMNSIPLPVKLNEFEAALVAEKVQLYWSTADDENVATYQIERSADNRNFTAVGVVSSFHQNNRNYNFTDNHPLKGRSWYRLRIIDEYNRINYSTTVLIKTSNDALLVYPTIVNRGEAVNLQFGNAVSGNVDVQLLNSSGAVVFSKTISVSSGTIYPVNVPSWAAGVYILSAMQNGNSMLTQKIIVQ